MMTRARAAASNSDRRDGGRRRAAASAAASDSGAGRGECVRVAAGESDGAAAGRGE